MSFPCREGHVSDEPDYCSVCGAAIPAGAAGAAASVTPIPVPRSALISAVASAATCPSCGEPREDPDGRFCEVCRYDFFEKRPGPPPVARAVPAHDPTHPPAKPAAPITQPTVAVTAPAPVTMGGAPPSPPARPVVAPAAGPPAPAATAVSWELIVAVDPSLDTEPDADNPCPVDRPEIVMPVGAADMLIGRHDETRAIHPEISLHDPGASRRHAKFVLDPDGGLALQDLASTNGTQVNGQDVPAGTRRRLRDGDRVTLGRWTRITVRGKA